VVISKVTYQESLHLDL